MTARVMQIKDGGNTVVVRVAALEGEEEEEEVAIDLSETNEGNPLPFQDPKVSKSVSFLWMIHPPTHPPQPQVALSSTGVDDLCTLDHLHEAALLHNLQKETHPPTHPPTHHNPQVARSPTGVNDLCTLDHLHEAALLHNLNKRHAVSLPYTAAQAVILATNPYRWVEGLYTEEMAGRYVKALVEEEEEEEEEDGGLPPHVYATAARAYAGMRRGGGGGGGGGEGGGGDGGGGGGGRNQSVLVSGESGSGKTESVKIMMDFLARVAAMLEGGGGDRGGGGGERGGSGVVDRVLQSNPLFEAFGNAKTARNDNSSRFGKFQTLEFDAVRGTLLGSHCQTYLLEKSRVVGPPASHSSSGSPGERNFHIFYQLLASSHPSLSSSSSSSSSSSPQAFNYTKEGDLSTTSIEGTSDKDGFKRTKACLSVIGVNEEVRLSLYPPTHPPTYLPLLISPTPPSSLTHPPTHPPTHPLATILHVRSASWYPPPRPGRFQTRRRRRRRRRGRSFDSCRARGRRRRRRRRRRRGYFSSVDGGGVAGVRGGQAGKGVVL